MTAPVVAQGVVTDPGAGHAAGYALVARSPSLNAEDADTLQTRPEVTDDLHCGPESAHYHSFFPLHGGWALTTRVIRGTRREAYNRVLSHALVLPPEALEACRWDAFVALESLFTPDGPGSEALQVNQLIELAADAAGALPDLRLRAPADPDETRGLLLTDHLARLCQTSTAPVEALAWVYSVLRAGRRALLDDSPAGRALLAASWASLTEEDRKRVPWTEHLAPGAEFGYRLACASRPEDLTESGTLGELWLVRGQNERDLAVDRAARVLAEHVVTASSRAAEFTAELGKHGIRVLEGDGLVRWSESTEWERWAIPGRTPVGEVLARVAQHGHVHAWIPSTDVLRWIATDLRERGRDAGASLDAVAAESTRALAQHGMMALVTPEVIQAATLDPGLTSYASLLALHATQNSRGHIPLRDIAVLLLTEPDDHPARRHTARKLAAALLSQNPPDGAGVGALGLSDQELSALAAELASTGHGAEPALLALLEEGSGARGVGHRIAVSGELLTIWAAIPDDDPARPRGLPRALDVLAADPARLAAAFHDLGGARLEVAIEFLRNALRDDGARARAVVAAAGALLGRIRSHAALQGLTGQLLDAGAPADGCVAFALAEAEASDAAPGTIKIHDGPPPEAWLSQVSALSPETALAVMDTLAKTPDAAWGPRRLALFRLALRGVDSGPPSIVPIVQAVAGGGADVLALWDEAVCVAAGVLGTSPDGHSVRRTWSLANAQRGVLPLSDGARALFRALGPVDRSMVAEAWRLRMNDLEAQDLPTLQMLSDTASPGSGLRFAIQLRNLRSEVERGALDPLDALIAASRASVTTPGPADEFSAACRALLPQAPSERAVVVLRAVADPRLWPTSRQVLRRELPDSFRMTSIPAVAAAAQGRSQSLAFDAARELGKRWMSDVIATLGFVLRLLEDRRFQLLTVFEVASGVYGRRPFPPEIVEAASGGKLLHSHSRFDAGGVHS